MRHLIRTIVALTCALLAAAPALSQSSLEHESEQTQATFPPLPLEPQLFAFPNEDLSAVAFRIQLGIASMPERRWFYRTADRFAPFEGMPAPDWKLEAAAAGAALDSTADDTIYTWSSLGPNGAYDVSGQTGGPGSLAQGRATAVWTHVEGPATVNKNVLYAGFADAGVWKTVDGGAHWTPLTDFQPTLSIGALDVLPGQDLVNYSDAIVYVGTGEGNFSVSDKDGVGVLKSTDGGATWTVQTLPWQEDTRGLPGLHRIRRLRIDRGVPNGQSVWVAGDGGVYHTADGGQTWSLVTGLPYSGAPAGSAFPGGCWTEYPTDFVVDESDRPFGNSTLFAAFGRIQDSTCVTPAADARKNNGVYRSVDGGATWTKISSNGFPAQPGLVGRITLLAAPSNPKHLYALIARSDNFQSLGIFDTLDATAPAVQWRAGSTTNYASAQGWYDLTGAVHPTDENTLIVGGLDNYLSRDHGVTLTKISGWSDSGPTWSHADHHHAVWADGTTYYDANDGGIFIGTIGASSATWADRNGDILSTLQFYGLSQSATQPNKINAGLQDNGHAFFDGTSWRETYGGDGGFAGTDQRDDSQAYEEYVYAAIRHSDDGGQSWPLEKCMQTFGGCAGTCGIGVVCVPDSHTAFIAWFTLDEHNQDVMYVGSNYLYRNLAASAASPVWVRIASDGVNGDFVKGATSTRAYISFIHTPKGSPVGGVPAMSQILYVGTSTGRVWRTADGGLTWTDLTKAPLPVSSPTTGRVVTWIDTDPTDPNRVIVTYSGFNASTNPPMPGHVFRSLDGGATWTDVSGALPDEPFNTAAVNPNPAETNEIYVASDSGVYVNTAGWSGTTWRRINNGMLPHVSVNMLQFTNATTPKRLRAATHGRGIWEMVKTFDPILALDRGSYGCDDAVNVSLQTALVGAGQQVVTVTSVAEPAGEALTLLESPPGSGRYVGTLRTSGAAAAAGDGRISVRNADRLTVRWQQLAAAADVDCSECGTPPSPAAGANLRIDPASVSLAVSGGDGDEFLDNCETGRVRFTVENVGDRSLTNLRISRVVASNPATRLPRLPVAIATGVPACATAQGTLSFTAQGLAPGEVLELTIEVTSDELAAAGLARAFTVRFGEGEHDFQLTASKTWSFEQGLDGWQLVRGTFAPSTTGGGANLSGGYVASSTLADNACDQIRSPLFRLTPTSTLSLYNQFSIEPIGPTTNPDLSWYDRANVALFDILGGSRTPVAPSGGRTYLASGPNGACVTANQPGWAGPGPGWLQSTWTAADLGAASRAGRALQLDVGYATDTSASLTGFWFDEVTLTNVELLASDQQGDVCRFCGELDDADPSVEYTGGWHRKSDPAATGGGYSRRIGNNKNGAAARLVFEARDITYLYGLTPSGGSAQLYLDGVLRQTVSYGGPASFGSAVTFSNLGPGPHELKVVHVSGTVIVDGFRLDCGAGSGANASAVEYRSQTQTSTGSATEGPVLVRTVEVKPGDVAVSVLVEGAPAPLTVRLLDPLGTLLSTSGALVPGLPASGLDAAVTAPGRYRLEIVNTLPLGGKVDISVARTVRVP
ncbi:MAG TPA: hypothetical protein VGG03_01935 [Thermoanaerobaculia bacterium]|jgi:hypothetical protein